MGVAPPAPAGSWRAAIHGPLRFQRRPHHLHAVRAEHPRDLLLIRRCGPLCGLAEEAFHVAGGLVAHQHARVLGELDEGMRHANDVNYGLTSGFYGTEDEGRWYFDRIQAGVNYVNRPMGATTGAWPGFQPFGGWKGSGSSGKNGGGVYYLPLYMREQIQTVIS